MRGLVLLLLLVALPAGAREARPSTSGVSGLGTLPTTDVMPSGSVALTLAADYFGSGSFIVPGAAAQSLSGVFAATWAYRDLLEVGWRARASRSSLRLAGVASSLEASTLGDERFLVKVVRSLGPDFTGGLVGALDLPAPRAGYAFAAGIGGEVDLMGSWWAAGAPWRVDLLAGYQRDRSGDLLPAQASAFETFALDLSLYDELRASLAFEWTFGPATAFAESLVQQPLAGPLPATWSDASLRVTLGGRLAIGAGFGLVASIDVAADPWRADAAEAVTVEAPYLAGLALTYAFEPGARPAATPADAPSPPVPMALATTPPSPATLPSPPPITAARPAAPLPPAVTTTTAPLRVPPAEAATDTPPAPTTPAEVDALVAKAKTLRQEGDWPRATAYLRAAFDASGEADLLRLLGEALLAGRHAAGAITAWSKFLTAAPTSPHAADVQKSLAALAIASVPGAAPPSDTLPPVISHTVCAAPRAGEVITVVADLDDESGIAFPLVQYRTSPDGPFLPAALVLDQGHRYVAHLPATSAGTLWFYVEAYDTVGNGPTRDGTPTYPHEVAVEP